ncbi:ELMO domain-containing protein 2-like isoform X1 [Sycon ciliatum]|uniref:ELMO domain-containing protein 2-like isoform X1 n=1 Tax=Sycon ciliatum TaxID=27933 RepID=UPI0031F68CE9
MGMILSRLVKSSSSQAAAAGRRPWAMSVSPELAGYVYVTAACAPHNQALPVLHEYESKLSQVSNEVVRQTLKGDANANVDHAVVEICRAEGLSHTIEERFADNLRACLVQIHSVAAVIAHADRLRAERFTSENSEHEEALLELWSLLQPDVALTERMSKQWTDIGFQGNNPATDFRGMGYLGLLNLIYFAKHRTAAAQRLLLHSQHPTIGYGFALAGINMTSLVLELLSSDHLQAYFYKECCGKTVTLQDLQDVFCGLFEQFDRFWIAREPENVMAFNAVRSDYKLALERSLRTRFAWQLSEEEFAAVTS